MSSRKILWTTVTCLTQLITVAAHADPAANGTTPTTPQNPNDKTIKVREIELDDIREKYWNQNKDVNTGVVQNRVHAKKHRFEFTVIGGALNGDPFLNTHTLGASLGFHFNEYYSIHAVAWKAFVQSSSALTSLQNQFNTTTNTNNPQYFVGGESRASLLYGKLSLGGELILYLDAYFSLGAGDMSTQSGDDLAFYGGIGQQIHISRLFSLNLDYRIIYYNETIVAKVAGPSGPVGTNLGNSGNWSGIFSVGLSVFFNLF